MVHFDSRHRRTFLSWPCLSLLILASTAAASSCTDTSVLGRLDGGGEERDARRARGQYDECGNGMDDDGDRLIDEDCFCGNGETQSCFNGLYPNRAIGICSDGIQSCQTEGSMEFGRWGSCESDQVPISEICGDDLDNDCDAAIDEGCACSAGQSWECGLDFDIVPCRPGTQICRADGTRSACEGAVGPSAEVCDDAIDNDCDGMADEGCGCVPEPEVCRDGVDNDCDGEIDEPACDANAPVNIVQMSAYRYHMCAVTSFGEVLCWGRNLSGVLGDGTTEDRPTPTRVVGLSDALEVSAGEFHTCAIHSSAGTVVCWGLGDAGRLGDGGTTSSATPVDVMGLTGVRQLSSGIGFSCAMHGAGLVSCWGENLNGLLGNGMMSAGEPTPSLVEGVMGAVELNCDNLHCCTRRSGGEIRCWGDNRHLQLGGGIRIFNSTPVVMLGLTDPMELGAGADFRCARHNGGGEIACLGYNQHGELGDGTVIDRAMPVMVQGVTDAAELAVGSGHSCVRRVTGDVLCWGRNNFGQLGDGSTDDQHLPVPVPGLSDVVELVAGTRHTCARQSTGAVLCWGDNSFGQLGDGTLVDRHTPTPVLGIGR